MGASRSRLAVVFSMSSSKLQARDGETLHGNEGRERDGLRDVYASYGPMLTVLLSDSARVYDIQKIVQHRTTLTGTSKKEARLRNRAPMDSIEHWRHNSSTLGRSLSTRAPKSEGHASWPRRQDTNININTLEEIVLFLCSRFLESIAERGFKINQVEKSSSGPLVGEECRM